MGGTPGIISEIMAKISYCEFCDRPADSEHVCNIYTIDKIDDCGQIDLSKNIIVMCPECKHNYDVGAFGKKHLKACVMLRDPELSAWLSELFWRYNIRLKQDPANKRSGVRGIHRLINDQRVLDNAMFLFGIFFIVVGILLFAYGYSAINGYDSGSLSSVRGAGDNLFFQFYELAGVALALIGLFSELCNVKGKEKPGYS